MDTMTLRMGHTTLFALVFLFFLQVWTFWVESIYRYSLVKLSPGLEMLSLLFIFAPLLVLLMPRKLHTAAMLSALVLLVAVRVAISMTPFPWAYAIAGAGAGAGLVFLCFLIGSGLLSRVEAAIAVALTILMSVALRVWGSSLDVSMVGPGKGIGIVLAVLALLLYWRVLPVQETPPTETSAGVFKATGVMIGLFTNITLGYLAFSSPAVISAWTGASYPAIVLLLVGAWGATLLLRPALPSRGLLVAWNLLFTATLAGSLYAHTPAFPTSPGAPAITIGVPSVWSQLPLYLMVLLSPVVYMNVRALWNQGATQTPRGMAVPVFLGGFFMLAVTLCLIFTNVWGYMGAVSAPFRGQFYMPFLVTGLVSAVAVLLAGDYGMRQRPHGLPALLPTALALLIIAGLVFTTARPPEVMHPEKQLTVLTYNIQQGSALTGEPNWQAQLEFIRAVDADLIGLQESDMPRPSGGNVDASRYFAESLGYYRYFGPATVGGTYGTAILSRYPLENSRCFYTYSQVDETATAVVEITVAGRRIAFFNSHPAGPRESHQAHADALVERTKAYENVIAVGDYNCRQDSPWYEEITGLLEDSWLSIHPDATGPRHPTIGNTGETEPLDMARRIDHIFVSDTFTVEAAWYVPTPESGTDHPAHWAVLTWE